MQRAAVQRHGLFLGIAIAVTFAFALLRFAGPTEGYWDTYITAPAVFMNGEGIDFVLKDGSPAWDVELQGVLPDDLIDKSSFGIITKDQRIGAPIVAAPLFTAFGLLGMRVLFALSVALIVPAGFLACRSALALFGEDRPLVGLAAGLMMAWNPYVLSIDRLNANLLALALGLVVIHLLLLPRAPLVAVGLLFGVLAGIRNEAICFVPAICLWLLSDGGAAQRSMAARFRRLCTVGACTVVAMLPVFYWKWAAFGHPLMHPSQYPHFQGFRPEFEHALFGAGFSFNGLFNWPLHDRLVRTPHFGYPTYLLFPLVTLRSLGALASALLLLGLGRMWSDQRRLALFCLAWMVPVYLLFGPQENWEEVKMTFMLLSWPPLALFFGVGLAGLSLGAGLRRSAAVLASLTVALMLVARLLGSVDVPADERWYVRFPNASLATNPEARAGLAVEARNDWEYFQSYETDEEIERERDKLRSVWPWPASYLPVRVPATAGQDIAAENGQRELQVLEIWGYIYGSRR